MPIKKKKTEEEEEQKKSEYKPLPRGVGPRAAAETTPAADVIPAPEVEETPLTATWRNKRQKKVTVPDSYKPLPQGVGPGATQREEETIPTPSFTSSILNLMGLGDAPLDAQQGRDLVKAGQDTHVLRDAFNLVPNRLAKTFAKDDEETMREMLRQYGGYGDEAIDKLIEQGLVSPTARYDTVQDNSFTGQAKANYILGDLQQQANILLGQGIINSDQDMINRGFELKNRASQYAQANKEALSHDSGVIGNTLAQDMAQYAPQFVYQQAAALPAQPLALLGKPGEAAAQAFGAGSLSYTNMAGAAYADMVDRGADADTAAKLAKDEAAISSVIESGDEFLGWMFGAGSNLFGNGTAGKAADSLSKRLLKGLGKYALSVEKEGDQELLQEMVSMANERRLADGATDGGWQQLLGYLGEVIAEKSPELFEDVFGGEGNEDTRRLLEAYRGGKTVAAWMGLVPTGVGAVRDISNYSQNNTMGNTGAIEEMTPTAPGESANPLTQTLAPEAAPAAETDRDAIIDKLESLTRYADQLRIKGDTANEAAVREQIAQLNQQLQGETPTPVEVSPEAPAQNAYTSRIAEYFDTLAAEAEQNGDIQMAAALRERANQEREKSASVESFPESALPSTPGEQMQAADAAELDRQFREQWYNENPAPAAQTLQEVTESAEGIVTDTSPETNPNAGTRPSQTVETVRNSQATPEEFQTLIDQEREKGGFRYAPVTNDETTQAAIEHITRDGWTKAYTDWQAAVKKGVAGADMTVTGLLLYNHAVEAGDTQLAMDILSDIGALGTTTGQGLQAFRIINEGLSPANRLLNMEKAGEILAKKYGLDDIKISDELKAEYLNAESEEARNEVIDRIKAEVRNQLPVTAIHFEDGKPKVNWRVLQSKWNALRYLNMLGNFKTQKRNLQGNTAMAVTTTAKNAIQSLIEFGAYVASGGKYQRTTSLLVTDRALMKAAKADYQAHADWVNGEGKFSDTSVQNDFARDIEDSRRVFWFLPAEWARRATKFAMEKGDTIFIAPRYARTLAGYLQANGMDGQTFQGIIDGTITPTKKQSRLIEDARAYSAKEAQEATFHDRNKISDLVSQFGRRDGVPKGLGILAEGLQPFRRTPANVFVRAEEYSPLGLANTAYKGFQLARGNATTADVINQFSKTLTGSGIFLLGMLFHSMGIARGKEDDEKQSGFDKLRGEQDYSLRVPASVDDMDLSFAPEWLQNTIRSTLKPLEGKSITMDWMAPVSIPFFMGVELDKARQEDGFSVGDITDSLSNISDPMIQMSMMQGVNDTLEDLSYSDSKLERVAFNLALSYLGQGLTNSLMGQLERTSEDRRYSTFIDRTGEGFLSRNKEGQNLQYQLGRMSAKTPVLDYNQVEYVDAWGRTQDTGTPFSRAYQNLFSSGYSSNDRSTEVDDELQRLYDAGQGNVFPKKIPMSEKVSVYDSSGNKIEERNLTADEYVTFQKVMGKKSLELVKDLMRSNIYDGMSDDARAKAISNIYSYAKNLAAQEVESSTKKEYAAVSRLSNIAGYYAVRAAYSEATGDENSRDYASLDNMLNEYQRMPEDVRALIDKNTDKAILKLAAAKEAGIDSRGYYKVIDAVKAIPPAEGHNNPIKWQKLDYVGSSKLTDAQKDYFMDQYLEDDGPKAKYKACRDAGYTPSDIAAFYRINETTKGVDRNHDGHTDRGTEKAAIIKAAVAYGFSKKQATALYNMWHSGKWG